ncbi:MAG: M48 family metallopeptidase [Pseudomonadota bacterium]
MLWATFGLFMAPAMIAALLGAPTVLLVLSWTAGDATLALLFAAIIFLHTRACAAMLASRMSDSPARRRIEVSRRQTPALFAEVDSITNVLHLRPLKTIRIAAPANAALAQRPRWFGIAGHSVELTLGLPLLRDTPREVLRAVLAHELAHAARRDGVRYQITARVLSRWRRIADTAHTHTFVGAAVMARLAGKYLMHFERLARTEMHHAELAADAEARRIVGGRALAEAVRLLHRHSIQATSHPTSQCRLAAIAASPKQIRPYSDVRPEAPVDLLHGHGPRIARFLS